MSMIDPVSSTMVEPWDKLDIPVLAKPGAVATPIVPGSSIAGRALTAVVAIMAFLASLTTGMVMLVLQAAGDWEAEVGREVTIQVRPVSGRDIEADIGKATSIAHATSGFATVRAYTKEESAKLVEPWLGSGLAIDDLPIPRLIVIKLMPGAKPNFSVLRKDLAAQVPSASLDDHRRWIDRMRSMAGTAVAGGFGVLALVLAATAMSVTFATRGTMAANRPIIEVLHYVGATDGFIGRQFQRHFLLLGLKGGAIGGAGAMLLFGAAEAINNWLPGTAAGDEVAALFGTLSIGVRGYLAILAQIVLMALVTGFTSRRTVNHTLETID
jgi:cell division transport system permease protein